MGKKNNKNKTAGKNAQNPTNGSGTSDLESITDPETLKNMGNEEYMKGNHQEAIKLYTLAIENGESEIYFSNRAQALLMTEQYEDAVRDCDQALQINANCIKAYYRKSQALNALTKGNIAQHNVDSIDALQKGIELARVTQPIQFELIEEMQKLLNTALEEQKQDSVLPDDHFEVKTFKAMDTWLKEQGSQQQKLKMRFYAEDYRGIHASRDIKKGETVLFVPKQALMTLEAAMGSPIGQQMAARQFRQRLLSPKHSFLSCMIMEERRKPDSHFKTFLEILPKQFTNFPIFFTREERELLHGSPFQNQISDKIKDIQADYNLICKEVPDFRQFPLKEYSECRMMICSRVFGIEIDGRQTDAMVAYADMLNHKRPRQTGWWYDDDLKGFVIEAIEDIKRGDQVYDSYGRKCNTRFLLNYGFINLNNDGDEFPFKIALDAENDDNFQFKKNLLGNEPSQRTYRALADLREEQTQGMFSWLRFVLFKGDMELLVEAKQAQFAEQFPNDPLGQKNYKAENISVLSSQNEKDVHSQIRSMCDTYIKLYPQTIEEDEEILKREDLSFNHRNCILFRIGEKRILAWFIKFADFVHSIFDMGFKNAKRQMNQLPREFENARDYLDSCVIPLILKETS